MIMGVFSDDYYYKKYNGNIAYLQYRSEGSENSANFYINDQLIGQKTYNIRKDGLSWKFGFEHENVSIDCVYKGMKPKHKLLIDGKEEDFQKVKKNELRRMLTAKKIYNKINPTQKEIEASKFKLKEVATPLVLSAIAIPLHYYTLNMEKVYWLIPGIPCLIAGFMFAGVLFKYFPFMQTLRKFSIAVVILLFFLTQELAKML